MPRLPGLPAGDLPPDVRRRFEEQTRRYGRAPEGTPIMARRPGFVPAWNGMFEAERASGLLPQALRNLIHRLAALLVECEY